MRWRSYRSDRGDTRSRRGIVVSDQRAKNRSAKSGNERIAKCRPARTPPWTTPPMARQPGRRGRARSSRPSFLEPNQRPVRPRNPRAPGSSPAKVRPRHHRLEARERPPSPHGSPQARSAGVCRRRDLVSDPSSSHSRSRSTSARRARCNGSVSSSAGAKRSARYSRMTRRFEDRGPHRRRGWATLPRGEIAVNHSGFAFRSTKRCVNGTPSSVSKAERADGRNGHRG